MDASAIGPACAVLLDRHQGRREAGLPTVSVLSGAVGLGVQLGRRWAEETGRGVVVVDGDDPGPEALVDAWVDALAAGRDLARDALAWLARRRHCAAAELGPVLGRKTPFERVVFLESALPEQSDVDAACRWLLAGPAEASPAPGLAARLGAALAAGDADGSRERVVAALVALVPAGGAPVLLVVPPASASEPELAGWLGAGAASLARLAEAAPRLTLLLASTPEALAAYHRLAPESRARALVRVGTLNVPALDAAAIGRRLDAILPGASARLDAPIRRLAADGAMAGLVDRFVDAAGAVAAAGPEPEAADRARSAAERFLFERLETLPQTAGRFALNVRLDVPFGAARTMEVDLAAPALALAVEIDGYHHFRDAEDYRRDRRKDYALQTRGYLVVRVLADDVVGRLEEVLDRILAAVEFRKH